MAVRAERRFVRARLGLRFGLGESNGPLPRNWLNGDLLFGFSFLHFLCLHNWLNLRICAEIWGIFGVVGRRKWLRGLE